MNCAWDLSTLFVEVLLQSFKFIILFLKKLEQTNSYWFIKIFCTTNVNFIKISKTIF
jgi:hypothetical protein